MSYCLIDGSGKAFIQDGAFVLISFFKFQRHHEGVTEVQPGLQRKRGQVEPTERGEGKKVRY